MPITHPEVAAAVVDERVARWETSTAARLAQLLQLRLPVDIDRVARDLGATVVDADIQHDGLYDPLRHPRIYLRTGMTMHRRRFTLAHELGHYLVENHRDVSGIRRPPALLGRDLERACDGFAAALLVPEHWLLRLIDHQLNLGLLRTIEYQANVSLEVAANRYARFSRKTCVLVWWASAPDGTWLSLTSAGGPKRLPGRLRTHASLDQLASRRESVELPVSTTNGDKLLMEAFVQRRGSRYVTLATTLQ